MDNRETIPYHQYYLAFDEKGARTNTSLLNDHHSPTSALWLSQLASLSWESYTLSGTKTLDLALVKNIDIEDRRKKRYLPSFLVFTYTNKKVLVRSLTRSAQKQL